MTEQAPCFQLGFDLLNVENSDYFEESSGEVACSFNKLWYPLIKSRTNFRKPRKRRISECVTVYNFFYYHRYEGFMFFGRRARCTS